MKIIKAGTALVLSLSLTFAAAGCQAPTAQSPSAETENSIEGDESFRPAAAPAASDYDKYDNTSQSWGQGVQFDNQNRPTPCMELQKKYGDLAADFIRSEDGRQTLYLTFDEGYENGYTDDILDTLREKNCPAVFFVTLGYAKENPELIQRMIDEGHIVGHHSAAHPKDGMPSLSIEEQVKDMKKLEEYIKTQFDYEMDLFRFPAGIFSERSLALMKDLGYRSVFWSFAYADWNPDKQSDPGAALEKLTARLHAGAIYLLHAVSSTNADILGDFIDSAREAGYEFCSYE